MTEDDLRGFRIYPRGRDIAEITNTVERLGGTVQDWGFPESGPASERVYVAMPPPNNPAAAQAIRDAVERWNAPGAAEDGMLGEHDDLVLQAMATLSEDDQERHMREMKGFLRSVDELTEAQRRGVLVAPYWRRRLAEIFTSEVERRERIGDPTHVVWAAWAEKRDLLERVEEILRDNPYEPL